MRSGVWAIRLIYAAAAACAPEAQFLSPEGGVDYVAAEMIGALRRVLPLLLVALSPTACARWGFRESDRGVEARVAPSDLPHPDRASADRPASDLPARDHALADQPSADHAKPDVPTTADLFKPDAPKADAPPGDAPPKPDSPAKEGSPPAADLVPAGDGAPTCLGSTAWSSWTCKLDISMTECTSTCGACKLVCKAGDCTCSKGTLKKTCSVFVFMGCLQCSTAHSKGCCDTICGS